MENVTGGKEEDVFSSDDSLDKANLELIAASHLPFEKFHLSSSSSSMAWGSRSRAPTEGSLACYMLRHGPLIPLPDPQPSSSGTTGKVKDPPAAVERLAIDLAYEVHEFAMQYNNIPFNHRAYNSQVTQFPMTSSEANLLSHLGSSLWSDVNDAFEAAPDLSYRTYHGNNTIAEDSSIRKVTGKKDLEREPKVSIIELKTPSSLSPQAFETFRTQQPSRANTSNNKMLCQIHKYFKKARVTWGALTNGLSTVFIRYEPVTKVFAMSEIIPHNHPSIIGYYCYLASLGDSQHLDHPRLSLSILAAENTHAKDTTSSKRETSDPTLDGSCMVQFCLEMEPISYGEFAEVNVAKLFRRTSDISIIAKVSYGSTVSNNAVKEEIEHYKSLKELWGSVLPQIYGMGEIIEAGEESDTYCIAMERLDKVQDWDDPERKNEAKKLIRQLHRCGFIHGDISKDNFRWRSDPGQMVIIDLGFSHRGTSDEIEEEIEVVDFL